MDEGMTVEMHPAGTARWFDDFQLGETLPLPSRALSADLFLAFTGATGVSLDRTATDRPGSSAMTAHPFLIAIQTTVDPGLMTFLSSESMMGIVEQSSRFVRAAHAGDMLHPLLQVVELEPGRGHGIVTLRSTVHNQRRELLLDGRQRWKLRNKPKEG